MADGAGCVAGKLSRGVEFSWYVAWRGKCGVPPTVDSRYGAQVRQLGPWTLVLFTTYLQATNIYSAEEFDVDMLQQPEIPLIFLPTLSL